MKNALALSHGENTWSENALTVLRDRYLKKDEAGRITEVPEDMLKRVATAIASREDESKREEYTEAFYNMMEEREFLPNSPTLMNAGRSLNSLAACYVLPIPDSTDKIFDTLKSMALIQKSGGGCISGEAWVFVKGRGPVQLKDLCSALPSPDSEGYSAPVTGIEVLTVDKQGATVWAPVDRVWRFAERPGMEVVTRHGSIRTSCEHPFLTVTRDGTGFVPAEQMKPGTPLFRPEVSTPLCFVGKAYLAGLVVGDGCLNLQERGQKGRDRLRIFSGDPAVLDGAVDIIEEQYGVRYASGRCHPTCWTLSAYNPRFLSDASGWILTKNKDENPGPLFHDLPDCASYIAGLMDSDGYVDSNRARASISTVSRALAENIRTTLGFLGVPTYLYEKKPGKNGTSPCFEVLFDVHDAPFLGELMRREFRKSRYLYWLQQEDRRTLRTPEWLRDLILESGRFDTTGGPNRGKIVSGGCDLQTVVYRTTRRTARFKIRHVGDELSAGPGMEYLSRAIDVQEVSPIVVTDLCDLSVPQTGCYVAVVGGLPCVVHNTGFSLDEMRPCGSFVSTSCGRSSGPIAFWRVYCEGTHAIQQGSFRRGASMAMMSVTHPDIIKFLFAKQDTRQFTNFNISVKATHEFMRACKESPQDLHVVSWEGKKWYVPRSIVETCRAITVDVLANKQDARALDVCYGTQDLVPAEQSGTEPRVSLLTVGEVWDLIVTHAWQTGEPGLCFIDTVQQKDPTHAVAPIQATNPCAELPLPPWGLCCLGSINLNKFVAEDGKDMDWDRLKSTVILAVRFLDNVLDVNKYILPEIEKQSKRLRNIGLGVMGFHDALLRLGIAYDSHAGLSFGKRVMHFVSTYAIEASHQLAEERGAFEAWEQSRWVEGHMGFPAKYLMRNGSVTTCAPTGSLSILSDCSAGIEPWFSFCFKRQVLNGKVLHQAAPALEEVARARRFDTPELWDTLSRTGSLQGCKDVPDDVKVVFRTARDIDWQWHVKMQAAFQQCITSAVSKTINLPADAPKETVAKAYILAHEQECKGITVYRDGCRSGQPMALVAEKKMEVPEKASTSHPRSVPEVTQAIKVRRHTQLGTLHVHVTVDEDQVPLEIFAQLGKGGDLVHADLEAMCRMASLFLRVGGDVRDVIHQWKGINTGAMRSQKDSNQGTSLPDELSAALTQAMAYLTISSIPPLFLSSPDGNGKNGKYGKAALLRGLARQLASNGKTPGTCEKEGCSGLLVREGGCEVCYICGYSRCG